MQRYLWIDRWKGFLIVLVVLGHAVGGAEHFTSIQYGGPLDDVYLFIYRFHMHAFFLIMGILWHDLDIKWDIVWKKIKRLLIPYFVFGMLSLLVYALVYHVFINSIPSTSIRYNGYNACFSWTSLFDLLLGRGVPENSVLWFLPCMFVVWFAYNCFGAVCRSRYWHIMLCGFSVVVNGVMSYYSVGSTLPWGGNRFFEFLPFVIIGRYFFSKNEVVENRKLLYVMLVCIGWWIYSLMAPVRIWSRTPLSYSVYHAFGLVRTILGVLLSMLTIQLLPSKHFTWLSTLGKVSLGIMLVHKWFVVGLEMKVGWLRAMFGQELPVALIAVFIVTVISVAMSYVIVRLISIGAPWAIGEKQ